MWIIETYYNDALESLLHTFSLAISSSGVPYSREVFDGGGDHTNTTDPRQRLVMPPLEPPMDPECRAKEAGDRKLTSCSSADPAKKMELGFRDDGKTENFDGGFATTGAHSEPKEAVGPDKTNIALNEVDGFNGSHNSLEKVYMYPGTSRLSLYPSRVVVVGLSCTCFTQDNDKEVTGSDFTYLRPLVRPFVNQRGDVNC